VPPAKKSPPGRDFDAMHSDAVLDPCMPRCGYGTCSPSEGDDGLVAR